MDEFANQKIPNFEHLISVIRSREISAHVIVQTQSQLKAVYKDHAETFIGNCSSVLFLGGKEQSTLKEMSAMLGKETIDTFNTSDTRGSQRSYGLNYQKLGKELLHLTVKSSVAQNYIISVLDKTTILSHNKKRQHCRFQEEVGIMPKKGERTKSEIINIAKMEFCKKGFSAVSMSDLCEATGLSRGGLYRHFSSTDEVFIALLEADKDDWQAEMDKAMEKGVPAIHMMGYYLEQMRMGIAEGVGGLSLAIYEFMRNRQVERVFLDARYDFAVNMMKSLLQYGQQRGEFKPFNLQTVAEHIVIFLDGLQTASAVIPFSDEVISRQLNYILEKIKMEER